MTLLMQSDRRAIPSATLGCQKSNENLVTLKSVSYGLWRREIADALSEPHWKERGATYFLTKRASFSILGLLRRHYRFGSK